MVKDSDLPSPQSAPLLGNVRGGDCLVGSKTSCNLFFIFLVFIVVIDVDLKS